MSDLIREKFDLDLPDGVEYRMTWEAGKTEEEGTTIHVHNFQVTFQGETEPFQVVAESDASEAQIEDLMTHGAAKMFARIVEKIKRKGNRLSLKELKDHDDYRKDFAALLRDYRKSAQRRKTFSTGKIYQAGITLPSKGQSASIEDSRSS